MFKVKPLKYDATAREKKRDVGCRKSANQWTSFYMTWNSVIKELMSCRIMQTSITNFLEQQFLYTWVIIARNLHSKRVLRLLNILYKTTPPCGDKGFILLTLVLTYCSTEFHITLSKSLPVESSSIIEKK